MRSLSLVHSYVPWLAKVFFLFLACFSCGAAAGTFHANPILSKEFLAEIHPFGTIGPIVVTLFGGTFIPLAGKEESRTMQAICTLVAFSGYVLYS